MYQRIRKGLRLIGKDIHALLPAIAALAVYWTVTHLLFDRFCPMQILLGLPCPGCGMTRALGLVLTGHLAAAWKMQPPVYGWMVAGVVFGVQRYLVNREESEPEEKIRDCIKSGKSKADVENRRNKQAKMWTWVLIVLLLWEIGLYLWRMIYDFPVSVEDPGRTLYEVVHAIFA